LRFIVAHPVLFIAYFLVFLTGVVFLVLVGLRYGTLQFDEGSRVAGGVFVSRLLSGGLTNPSGYLASYQLCASGFWFYPFLYSSLAGLSFSIFGFGEFAARLPSVIFTVLLIHATICVTRELTADHKAALISGFFVATSPLIVIVGSGAMVDVSVATLTTYSLLFWIKGLRSRGRSDFLKAGVIGGLAGLMKPTGVLVLVFMVVFVVLAFLLTRERLVFSKNVWLGLLAGFLVFSVWIFSAVLANFFVGGWVGEEAIKGVAYWFGAAGSFSGYVPSWFSPQWYTLEGWKYYIFELIFMMGILPFVLVFVGVFSKLRKMRAAGASLLLFVLLVYVLQTLASNKNPRYVLTFLPFLYVFAAVGLVYACTRIAGAKPWKLFDVNMARRVASAALIVAVLVGSFAGLFSAVENRYIPGMEFGSTLPYRESVQLVVKDSEGGLVMPDVQTNLFSAPALTFYLASVDSAGRFGCIPPLLNPNEILTYEWAGKAVRYVFVYDLGSNVSEFVSLHAENFALLGEAQNTYGSIYVYKVKS
jgi:predicted membrane-bound dolichyl-phosphate-mannose-protein mannosyltransferase